MMRFDIRMAVLGLAGLCAIGFSAPASATILGSASSALTAPPSTPAGSVVLQDFNGTVFPGVTDSSRYNNAYSGNPSATGQTTCLLGAAGCNSQIYAGSATGFPAPPGATKFLALSTEPLPQYQWPTGYSPASGGVGFFDLFFPSSVTSVSFYTGNVSAYAAVDVMHGASVTTFTASSLGIADSNAGYELTFSWDPSDGVDGLQLVLGYNVLDGQVQNGVYMAGGFEAADFVGTLVPEPASLSVLLAGLAATAGIRRRKAAA